MGADRGSHGLAWLAHIPVPCTLPLPPVPSCPHKLSRVSKQQAKRQTPTIASNYKQDKNILKTFDSIL